LPLLVLGRGLPLKVVDPARFVERVEEAFERGGRLPRAHSAETLVQLVVEPRWPELSRPDGPHLSGGKLYARPRHGAGGTAIISLI
jgi:hypothetical protein